ncbi:MAG: hypothetical protein KKF48_01070 [Nanoarchaeota archaeon]|nr:hypothetical protein [Nanoarchaeota archaeon]MBU1027614.1 hypothetical protein [Nanoarchaeota archaeon]
MRDKELSNQEKEKGLEILTRVYLHLKDEAEKVRKEYGNKKTEGERIEIMHEFHKKLYPMELVGNIAREYFNVDLDNTYGYSHDHLNRKL